MNQFLHEGIGSTIAEVLNKAGTGIVDDAVERANKKNKSTTSEKSNYSYSSLAKAASQLVAIFPILSSKTLSPETVQMVSKFIEQKGCNLFQLALQQANIDQAKSGIEYLKKYHQNIDFGGSGVSEVIRSMQGWIDAYYTSGDVGQDQGNVTESSSLSQSLIEDNIIEDCSYQFECDRDLEISSSDLNRILEIMSNNDGLEFYDMKLNPISINDYIVNESSGNYYVSLRRYDSLNEAKSTSGLREKYRNQVDRELAGSHNNKSLENAARSQAAQDQADEDADRAEKDRQYELGRRNRSDKEHKQDRKYELERRKRENQKYDEEKEARNIINNSGKNVGILKDQDIKKMNEAVPSLLVVRFYRSDTASVATEFIMGVKSKVISLNTDEILRRIMNDNKDGKKFLNFMRMITGELKFSEYLFGMSRVYDDIKSTQKKGAYGDTWKLLANRAKAAKDQLKRGQRNDFSSITTVLISKEDADSLLREENLDISDPKNALHFMNSYNLMAFAIADDATESLKIIFDDDSHSFEEIAYRMLERETQDGTYKKLINLMAASK